MRADDAPTGDRGLGREAVDGGIRHRHDHLGDRRGDRPERVERRVPVGRVAGPDEQDDDGLLADLVGWDERGRRERHDDRDRGQLLGRARGDRDEAPEDVGGRRQHECATEHHPDRVELELEARHDPEVAATAADRPEEVLVLVRIGGQQPAVGGHDLDRLEGIDRQTELPNEEADTAAERQPGDADRPGVPEGRCETMGSGGFRVLPGRHAGLDPRGLPLGVDVESLHVREIEHDAAVDGAVTCNAVTAAPHREGHPGFACQDHGARDVAGTGRLDDEGRAPIEHRVVREPGDVVLGSAGDDQLALELGAERRQVVGVAEIVAAGAERFQGRAPCGVVM